jgi:hypothetical protein
MGKGTYHDIPPHLHAAMRVLTLRLFETPINKLQPFDHLALESVLYQIFLTNTVLWSDQSPLTEFDVHFWLKAEHFLQQTIMFPQGPHSLNSPVLGVPVALFRLAIQAKQAYQAHARYSNHNLEQLRTEIEDWEAMVLGSQPISFSEHDDAFRRQQSYYDGATHLYVLIISLLLEQANKHYGNTARITSQDFRLPETVPQNAWQLQKALHILRTFAHDNEWSSCYIGNWPVYTLGFFTGQPEDVRLVINEMDRRWTSTKFMQIPRFRDDLESTWIARGLSLREHNVSLVY